MPAGKGKGNAPICQARSMDYRQSIRAKRNGWLASSIVCIGYAAYADGSKFLSYEWELSELNLPRIKLEILVCIHIGYVATIAKCYGAVLIPTGSIRLRELQCGVEISSRDLQAGISIPKHKPRCCDGEQYCNERNHHNKFCQGKTLPAL